MVMVRRASQSFAELRRAPQSSTELRREPSSASFKFPAQSVRNQHRRSYAASHVALQLRRSGAHPTSLSLYFALLFCK